MFPDIIGNFLSRQIIEVQAGDVVTSLFLRLHIGLRHLVLNPNQALYHRPSLGNGFSKIALYKSDFVIPFVAASVTLLLLQVPLVRLSCREGICGIFKEMALIALERKDEISLLLDNLFGYFYLCPHGVHRDNRPLKGKFIKELGHTGDFITLLTYSFLRNAQRVLIDPSGEDVATFSVASRISSTHLI